MEINQQLGISSAQQLTDKVCYQRLLGKLIYLTHTRSNIASTVSVVSQFMHAPSIEHMNAVHRILRYLKNAPGKGLMYSKNEAPTIEGYTDTDWDGDRSTRRSTLGYFTFVEGNLVTWRSKKQNIVSRLSAEAEFRGITHGLREILWIQRVLRDLGVESAGPMKLFCDNKSAIQIAQNPV